MCWAWKLYFAIETVSQLLKYVARGATDPIPPVHRIPRALLSVLVVLDRGEPYAGRAEHLDMIRQRSSEGLDGVGRSYSNDDSIRNQGLEGERHVGGSLGCSRVSQRSVWAGGQDRTQVSKPEANRCGGRGILHRSGETEGAVLIGSPGGCRLAGLSELGKQSGDWRVNWS